MSSDVMTSTTPDASRFISRLRCSEPRIPVTTISSRFPWDWVDVACCAAAGMATDNANKVDVLASAAISRDIHDPLLSLAGSTIGVIEVSVLKHHELLVVNT